MSQTYEFWNETERKSIMIDLMLKGMSITNIEYDRDMTTGVIYASNQEV